MMLRMVMVGFNGQTAIFTKEYLLITKKKILEFTKNRMEMHTLVNGKMTKLKDKENLSGTMGKHMRVIGLLIKEMALEGHKQKMINTQVTGLMIKKKEKDK